MWAEDRFVAPGREPGLRFVERQGQPFIVDDVPPSTHQTEFLRVFLLPELDLRGALFGGGLSGKAGGRPGAEGEGAAGVEEGPAGAEGGHE